MPLDFQSRNIVITGGTGALGTAVVAGLLSAGARCTVSCLDRSELKHFPYTAHERTRILEGINLAEEPGVAKLYEPFSAREPLWASIHIAGGFAMSSIDKTTGAELAQMLQTNIATTFLCCREAVRAIRAAAPEGQSPGGRIVNVAARPGLIPELGSGMVAYTASKAAVVAITRALAAELAPQGVWVNAVAPSIMDTPANRKSMPKADHASWPKVEEVAATIAFLASPQNAVTRGAIVPVYGRV
jgi:NAD(P)-dependent dehydrogenase (short-subunit alcohol dehydrogenase family)